MPPRRSRPLGASISGILNSDAKNDEEAKRRVTKLFGSILLVIFFIDILCSLTVVIWTCQHTTTTSGSGGMQQDHPDTSTTTDGSLGSKIIQEATGTHYDYDDYDLYDYDENDPVREGLIAAFPFLSSDSPSTPRSSLSLLFNQTPSTISTIVEEEGGMTTTTNATGTNTSTSQCVRRAITTGFLTFQPMARNDGKTDTLGDLLVMSIMRAITFLTLLGIGIWFGSSGGGGGTEDETPETEGNDERSNPGETNAVGTSSSSTCIPVPTDRQPTTRTLSSITDDEDDDDNGDTGSGENDEENRNTAVDVGTETASDRPTSTPHSDNDLTQPLLEQTSTTTTATNNNNDNATNSKSSRWCSRWCYVPTQKQQIQTVITIVLFGLCTYYQVYAGLKVATLVHPNNAATHNIVPLLCLTVLWINIESYVFRTLLSELTREHGLYLPPEVHRHPMYLVKNRNISVHWCDLCHQPIGGRDRVGSSNRTSASGNDGSSNGTTSCYRCALCDFDVCLKCAKRSDAATVGENILRTDRGVRVETSLTTSGYIKRSVEVAKSELPLIMISFLLLAATSISRLLLPDFQGRIIDKVIPDPTTGEYDRVGFTRFIRIYVAVMVAQATLLTLYSAILTLVSRRLKFTLRNALLEKILIQDVAYFDGTESGRLISRLTNDLDLMMSPIQSSLSSLLSNILILFGGLVMCFAKSYRLSMISFITIGPISALWEQYALWSKGLAREMLSYWGEGNSIASQVLSHIRTVKAFGCETKVLKKYSDTNEHALHCGVKDAWGNALTTALTGLLDLGSGVLILWFGGLLVFRGELTVGELVTFQLFWNMMNNAFQNLQGLITSFTRSAAGAEKVFSMWDSHPDIDPKRGSDIDWQVDGHIQLKDVKFFYQMRPDNIVLNQFSLDIPAGKTLALVGRSGGGKSTIINLLLRFYDPREGKLILDGRDYDSIKVDQLRRLFGVVTQETELFALTVEENIAYGLDKDEYTMEDVIDAAKKSFAHDFISEMKDGYQTRIGERGNRLSGGQRQRLAIARVFLRKPKLILLDEATSALDENSQEAVQKALANLIQESQATVVLVAHRLSTVVNADNICVIDKGTVLEQGNHEELVAKGGIYASMVEKQLKKKEDELDQDGNQKKNSGGKKAAAADDIDALLDDSTA